MPIFGVDIHPRYQAGISIEQIRAEGFDFMAVKVSEAVDSSFMGAGASAWIDRGKKAGLLCLGYHYLRPGNEAGQAKVFAAALKAAGVPGMLDAEALTADGKTPTLAVVGIRRFLAEATRLGARIPLLYLPHWYWERLGRPSLAGLPAGWASRYVGTAVPTGPASAMYQKHNPAGWESYGGLNVQILQFSDRGRVAGRNIDVNAYKGTRDQLAELISNNKREDSMASIESIERMVGLLKPGLVLSHRSANVRHRAANGRPEDDQYGHVLTAAAEAADARVAAEAALAETKRLRADLEVALPKIYAQLTQLLAAHEDPGGDDNMPTLLSGKD